MKGLVYSSSIYRCEQYLKSKRLNKGDYLMVSPSNYRSLMGVEIGTLAIRVNHDYTVGWCLLDSMIEERKFRIVEDTY